MDRIIELIKYIIIALIQGVAEILPISSSAHLFVAQRLLSIPSTDMAFEVFLHFASLIAIVFYFRKRLIVLIKDFFAYIIHKKPEAKQNFLLCMYLIVATIPAAICGLLLEDIISAYTIPLTVGLCWMITGGMLYYITKAKKSKGKEMTYIDALIIGLFQCLGLFSGISRSGACLTGGVSRKMRQSDSAEFAFLMAIPIILGSTIVKLGDISAQFTQKGLLIPYLVAFLVCLVTTYLSLVWILKIIRRRKLTYFAAYCFIIGVLYFGFSILYI